MVSKAWQGAGKGVQRSAGRAVLRHFWTGCQVQPDLFHWASAVSLPLEQGQLQEEGGTRPLGPWTPGRRFFSQGFWLAVGTGREAVLTLELRTGTSTIIRCRPRAGAGTACRAGVGGSLCLWEFLPLYSARLWKTPVHGCWMKVCISETHSAVLSCHDFTVTKCKFL